MHHSATSRLLATLCLLWGACSGNGTSPEADAGPATDGAPDAHVDAAPADAADRSDGSTAHETFRVYLSSDTVELCPEQCATLEASVEGARGQLAFAWSHDLGDAREHQVCPTETTTYRVEATDSLEAGEFEDVQTDDAQLTVTVKTCDPESPVLCEARFRGHYPNTGNLLRAEEPWMAAFASNSSLTRGPDGAVYLMGAFGRRLDLGADVLEADSSMHGFVHKLNAECEPEWTRRLDPSTSGDVIVPSALASDEAGNAYAISTSGPLVDLDPLAPVPFRFVTELVVYKLSPAGEEVYRSTLPVALGGAVHDAVVDAEGNLYMPGFAHAYTDFGGGPLGLSPTTYHTFLLSLDARGQHRVTETNARVYRFARAGESLIFVDNALEQVDLLASLLGFFPRPDELPALVSRSLPGLAERWRNPIDDMTRWTSYLAGHADGSALGLLEETRENDDNTVWTTTFHTVRYDADGTANDPQATVRMSQPVPEDYQDNPAPFRPPHPRYLTAGPSGRAIAVAGQYRGEVTLEDGTVLESHLEATEEDEVLGYLDGGEVFATKIAGDASVVWTRRLELGEYAAPMGLVLHADGHVWVGSQARVANTTTAEGSFEQDVVVTKLRADP